MIKETKIKFVIAAIFVFLFFYLGGLFYIGTVFQNLVGYDDGTTQYRFIGSRKDASFGIPYPFFYFVQGGGPSGYQGLTPFAIGYVQKSGEYHPFKYEFYSQIFSTEDSYIQEGHYFDPFGLAIDVLLWFAGYYFLTKVFSHPRWQYKLMYLFLFIAWIPLMLFLIVAMGMSFDVGCMGEGSSCNG